MDDANYEHSTANGAILRLTKELAWIGEWLLLQETPGVCLSPLAPPHPARPTHPFACPPTNSPTGPPIVQRRPWRLLTPCARASPLLHAY